MENHYCPNVLHALGGTTLILMQLCPLNVLIDLNSEWVKSHFYPMDLPYLCSLRSACKGSISACRRQHRAWGVSPRVDGKESLARETGGSGFSCYYSEPVEAQITDNVHRIQFHSPSGIERIHREMRSFDDVMRGRRSLVEKIMW